MSIYCSSVNGTLTKRDFEGKQSVVLLDTMDIMFWWTTVVYSHSRKMLFTGGNTGRAVIMDRDGTKVYDSMGTCPLVWEHGNLSTSTVCKRACNTWHGAPLCIWPIIQSYLLYYMRSQSHNIVMGLILIIARRFRAFTNMTQHTTVLLFKTVLLQ